MAIEKLSDESINEHLTRLPGWAVQSGAITKTYQFANFIGSMEFVNGLAEAAESVHHHPDIDIRYDKVTVALVTHDAGGITDLDLQLAATAESLSQASRQ